MSFQVYISEGLSHPFFYDDQRRGKYRLVGLENIYLETPSM